MSHSVGPGPDPRFNLEALEQKLRALPCAEVPTGLPEKLIASIPVSKAAGASGTAATSRWLLLAAVSLTCVALSAGVYLAVLSLTSKTTKPPNENVNPSVSATTKDATAPSLKALNDYEQAVRNDPYNADAWFALAKAQANTQRSADAEESAQKAIDVARARNNAGFAVQVEAWRRSYRASQGKRSAK